MAKVNNNYNEEARVRNKSAAARRAELWVKEANSRLNELSKLLFALAVLVFTLSSPLLSRTDQLDIINRTLLLGSWIFNLLSLVFAVWSIWEDSNYFADLRKIESNSERIWSNPNKSLEEMYKEDTDNRQDMKDQSSFALLALQLFSVFIALLLLLAIGIRLLFV